MEHAPLRQREEVLRRLGGPAFVETWPEDHEEGNGDGCGDGYGHGCGYGNGNGNGNGHGCGYGHGDGYGYGQGYGNGYGYDDGNGYTTRRPPLGRSRSHGS